MLNYEPVVSEFEFPLNYYVRFRTNTLVKPIKLFIPAQLRVKK